MRRETFETPGPLRLEVRVPSGRIDLETVEGVETIVELEGSPEIEEAARIESDRGVTGMRSTSRSKTRACSGAFAATFECVCPRPPARTSRSRRPPPT